MIRSREFHIFSVYRPAGFDEQEIERLKPALQAADFSEAAAESTLNAFVEVTMKSQDRADLIARLLREYCEANALGFGQGRGKLVAVYSLGRLISRPAGEAVTQAIETARGLSGD